MKDKPRSALLIYQYYHHREMVEQLIRRVGEKGIRMDVLCWDNLHYSGLGLKGLWGCCHSIITLCKGGLISKVVRKLSGRRIVKTIINRYGLVDFHAFSECYLPLMKYCVKHRIQYDITLWGSDIMRANERSVKRKEFGFSFCRYIKASDNLQRVVTEKYQQRFDDKYRTVYFGSNGFEDIEGALKAFPDINSMKSAFIPEAMGRIVMTCGYNGSPAQNHLRILNETEKLPTDILGRIFLLIPLTYGATESYVRDVREALTKVGVPYALFTNRLSSDSIAIIRLVSDIVVNMQETDAFSASLREHLYCGNVLIVGDWLDYVQLDRRQVFYKRASFEGLVPSIIETVKNLDEYKRASASNRQKMIDLTSWDAVIGAWAESYGC